MSVFDHLHRPSWDSPETRTAFDDTVCEDLAEEEEKAIAKLRALCEAEGEEFTDEHLEDAKLEARSVVESRYAPDYDDEPDFG